ncbi:DUF5131 family protein [Streptosporangium sp. NPDC002721]|uniref:DUF5131 family protein n=1 Tax=Streptosporangium sp. NPDC002721 TaxID=3366188 RepID=UPI003686F1EF
MSDHSAIEWTNATWNPVTGCTKVSRGCDNCYAETFAERWRGVPGHHFERGFDVQLRPERLEQPLKWKRPRRIFVNSMSDLFHDQVPDSYIAQVFATMARVPQHTFQVLTKRHGRMRSLLSNMLRLIDAADAAGDEKTGWTLYEAPWPLPNLWLGVSVEDQQRADLRIPALLKTPAAVHWISAEPLLGSIDLGVWLDNECGECQGSGSKGYDEWQCPNCAGSGRVTGLDWVVAGGESGPRARPMHPHWPRALRDQCTAAGVPFFFKQWGEWAPSGYVPTLQHRAFYATADQTWPPMRRIGKKTAGRLLDGRIWDDFPEVAA